MSIRNKKIIFYIIVLLIFLIIVFYKINFKNERISYGVTFSRLFAEELGVDWRQAYLAALEDLQIKKFRIPAYWNQIEKLDNEYDFTDLDWQIAEAAKHEAKIILVIGQRVPRWPECFIPDWAINLTKEEREQKVLDHLRVLVNHYKTANNLVVWQVENEPLLSLFGDCPTPDFEFLKKEVDLVKSLDNRSVMITDSGELSFWLRTPRVADILGASVYRATYNKWWGYFYYPYPPAFYQWHAKLTKIFFPHLQKVIISEFQFEPWARVKMVDLDLDEQFKSFDLEKFNKNLKFIKRSGFDEVYLWGAEWWYWLKEKKGVPDFWDEAKKIEW